MATAARYGYFRDAMYYLDCGRHLAWGYVDQPPLIAFFAWLTEHTLGTSLRALLLWPALAGAGRILLMAAFARALGAQRFGTALAALLAATPLVWQVMDHQFAMNAFEALFWTGCAYAVLRMIQTGNPRWWLAFGAISGLGMENKYSMALFAFALLAGLLLSRARKLLFTPWLFAGGAVALVIFLPNLLWNIHHHWPFLELMHNIRASGRDVALPPLAYLAEQARMVSPFTLPFWLGGLGYFFFSREGRRYSAIGWAFVITIGFFMLLHGKDYYSAAAYAVVLAGGARLAERVLKPAESRSAWRLAGASACFVWLLGGIGLLLPLTLPVLPIESFVGYQRHFGAPPSTEHSHMGALLPQYYADEFGWPEMVAAVARVYNGLPPDERARTAIFAGNFGEAGALDLFGPQYGLPKAISGHQTYFLWGPRDYDGSTMILVGANIEEERQHFDSVQIAATLNNPYALHYELKPILLCRGLHGNLQTLWPRIKNWE